MNKWMLSGLMAIFLFSSVIGPDVFASSLKDLQDEKKQLEKKKEELNSGIDQKKVN